MRKSMYGFILGSLLSSNTYALVDECGILFNYPLHKTLFTFWEAVLTPNMIHESLGVLTIPASNEFVERNFFVDMANYPQGKFISWITAAGGGTPTPGVWDIEGASNSWGLFTDPVTGEVEVLTNDLPDACEATVVVL
ncbi:MAG: hypothetical protein AAGI44_07335 [Pseudomonadota bacterium]